MPLRTLTRRGSAWKRQNRSLIWVAGQHEQTVMFRTAGRKVPRPKLLPISQPTSPGTSPGPHRRRSPWPRPQTLCRLTQTASLLLWLGLSGTQALAEPGGSPDAVVQLPPSHTQAQDARVLVAAARNVVNLVAASAQSLAAGDAGEAGRLLGEARRLLDQIQASLAQSAPGRSAHCGHPGRRQHRPRPRGRGRSRRDVPHRGPGAPDDGRRAGAGDRGAPGDRHRDHLRARRYARAAHQRGHRPGQCGPRGGPDRCGGRGPGRGHRGPGGARGLHRPDGRPAPAADAPGAAPPGNP